MTYLSLIPSPDVNHGGSASDHLRRRAEAFAPMSALFTYLDLPGSELDDAQCRFYLSIYFAINSALHAFRDSQNTTDAYLKGLTTAVEMSATSNLVVRAGGSKLPSLMLVIMIAHHAVDTEDRNESTEAVFHVEEVFEFVEMVMMTSLESRMKMLRAMSSWLLTSPMSAGDLMFMHHAELNIFVGEIEQKWVSGQRAGDPD